MTSSKVWDPNAETDPHYIQQLTCKRHLGMVASLIVKGLQEGLMLRPNIASGNMFFLFPPPAPMACPCHDGLSPPLVVMDETLDGREFERPQFPRLVGDPPKQPEGTLFAPAGSLGTGCATFVLMVWLAGSPTELIEVPHFPWFPRFG